MDPGRKLSSRWTPSSDESAVGSAMASDDNHAITTDSRRVGQLSDSGIRVETEKSSDFRKVLDSDSDTSEGDTRSEPDESERKETEVKPSLDDTDDSAATLVKNKCEHTDTEDDDDEGNVFANKEATKLNILKEKNETIAKIEKLTANLKVIGETKNSHDTIEDTYNFSEFKNLFCIAEAAFDFNSSEGQGQLVNEKTSKAKVIFLEKSMHSVKIFRQHKKFSLKKFEGKYEVQTNRLFLYKKPVRLLDKKVKKIAAFIPHITLEEAFDEYFRTAGQVDLDKTCVRKDDQQSPENIEDSSSNPSLCSGQESKDDAHKQMPLEEIPAMTQRCDFCGHQAVYCCENCSYFYCEGCVAAMHPAMGPFLRHSVVPAGLTMTIRRCENHGQPRKLFCQICQTERCVDCCSTTCKLHFQSKSTPEDVDKEKGTFWPIESYGQTVQTLIRQLHQELSDVGLHCLQKVNILAMMEKLTSDTNSLNVYDTQVEDEILQIEMSALLKREQIRQEFVSFQELLIDSEALLCTKLQQEVRESLSNVWRGQQEALTRLRKDETAQTSRSVDLLQSEDTQEFIESTATIHERYRSLHTKIADFHKAWARGSIHSQKVPTPLLSQPFSLFLEKKGLNESIQEISGHEPRVTFLQKTVFIGLSEPLKVEGFVSVTGLGPSTTVKYHVQLQGTDNHRRALVWESHMDSLKGLELNTRETHRFGIGSRYLLKLQPTAVCQLSTRRQHRTACHAAHMLIIVSDKVCSKGII